MESLISKLKSIRPSQKPEWGILTAHHLVEHLSDALKVSTKKIPVTLQTPEEKLPRLREFLFSENPLPRSAKNPWSKVEGLESLRFKNIYEAFEELEQEWENFKDYFENAAPDETSIHPVFGSLTKEDWMQLHKKHFTHHLQQFGLL